MGNGGAGVYCFFVFVFVKMYIVPSMCVNLLLDWGFFYGAS